MEVIWLIWMLRGYSHRPKAKKIKEHDSISVGYVPSAHYRTSRGVSGQGGLCPGTGSLSRGSLSGGSLSRGYLSRGSSWQRLPLVMWPVVHTGTETPLWTEWQTRVKILPCCNFVAGDNKRQTSKQIFAFAFAFAWTKHSLHCTKAKFFSFIFVVAQYEQ